jgi:hypothetical protein
LAPNKSQTEQSTSTTTTTTTKREKKKKHYLEYVKESTRLNARLLIRSSQQGRLGTFFGQESGCEIELETLGDLVLELYLCA